MWNHWSLLKLIFCLNTTEKTKLENCYLDARVWVLKPVHRSPKQPGYVPGKAGKIRFSGTLQSVLIKASSGENYAPHNFVFLLMFTCSFSHMFTSSSTSSCTKWNRLWKDNYWNKFRYSCICQNKTWRHVTDMETLRNIDIPLVSSLLTLKRFHTFSWFFIVQFRKVLLSVFISRDQNTYK